MDNDSFHEVVMACLPGGIIISRCDGSAGVWCFLYTKVAHLSISCSMPSTHAGVRYFILVKIPLGEVEVGHDGLSPPQNTYVLHDRLHLI